jgi:hypothetical protein
MYVSPSFLQTEHFCHKEGHDMCFAAISTLAACIYIYLSVVYLISLSVTLYSAKCLDNSE